jgi:hypothetical protein
MPVHRIGGPEINVAKVLPTETAEPVDAGVGITPSVDIILP